MKSIASFTIRSGSDLESFSSRCCCHSRLCLGQSKLTFSSFKNLSELKLFTVSSSHKKYSSNFRFSIGIPALFTNELAARSRSETLSSLDALKNAEEIPWPLSDAVMSFLCQGLKGYDCWLTYENVQQALLYSLGGILEW